MLFISKILLISEYDARIGLSDTVNLNSSFKNHLKEYEHNSDKDVLVPRVVSVRIYFLELN